ncbi:MAG: acetyl-CoA carboxylase biotin carboxyl carrier protein subunit [Anaerolineae bacterium]|nr:acetyl-CoA carboxylase biotin carboxyl carrier protein subunit [Anaerolineae bacterium]
MKVIVKVDDKLFEVEIDDLYARPILAHVEGQRFEVWPEAGPAYGTGPTAHASPAAEPVRMSPPEAAPPRTVLPSLQSSADAVHAPIPGVIVSIAVKPGDVVEVGQELCILEAMKMKNVIRSPRAGEIASIHIDVGQHVQHSDLLIEFVES